MRKLTLILLLLLIGGMAFGQSRSTKLREVSGKWELTEDGRVAFRTIYEFPSKSQDRLFELTDLFFQRNFVDNPLQEVDWDRGYFRARAGFSEVHNTYRVYQGDQTISTIYDMTVELKESRVRVSVILQAYEMAMIPEEGGFLKQATYDPAAMYPVNPSGSNKDYFMNIFYKTYRRAQSVIDRYREFVYSQPNERVQNTDW